MSEPQRSHFPHLPLSQILIGLLLNLLYNMTLELTFEK